jgi:hypothetical protein
MASQRLDTSRRSGSWTNSDALESEVWVGDVASRRHPPQQNVGRFGAVESGLEQFGEALCEDELE